MSRCICFYGECRHAEGRYGEFYVSMRLRRSHFPDLTSTVLKSDQKMVRIDSFYFLEIFSVLNLSQKIEKIFFFLRLWYEKFHFKSLKQRWPMRFCRLLFEFLGLVFTKCLTIILRSIWLQQFVNFTKCLKIILNHFYCNSLLIKYKAGIQKMS